MDLKHFFFLLSEIMATAAYLSFSVFNSFPNIILIMQSMR